MTNRINTFLLNHGCKIENLTEYDPLKFISISDEDALGGYFKDRRFSEMYISGYIDFVYDTQVIFSWKQWDLIDQVWVYMINGIREALLHGEASFYFPDQPLLIRLSSQKDQSFCIYVEQKKYLLPYSAILTYIISGAELFFDVLVEFMQDETFDEIRKDVIPECKRLLSF